MGRRLGGEHRHRDDDAAAQPGHLGVTLHHLDVGEHLGPADVEGAVDVVVEVDRLGQVPDDVAHSDRLDAVVYPPGRDHRRQALGEVAHHLERRRPRTQDDRRLKHGCGHLAVEEHLPHLQAGGQVIGQFSFWVQAAQVDDPFHPGVLGCLGHVGGRPAIDLDKVGASQRVHQVVDDVDALHRRFERLGLGDVTLGHLNRVPPGHVAQLGGGSHQASHSVPILDEARRKPSADVAGRSGEQDLHPPRLLRPPPSCPTGARSSARPAGVPDRTAAPVTLSPGPGRGHDEGLWLEFWLPRRSQIQASTASGRPVIPWTSRWGCPPRS